MYYKNDFFVAVKVREMSSCKAFQFYQAESTQPTDPPRHKSAAHLLINTEMQNIATISIDPTLILRPSRPRH